MLCLVFLVPVVSPAAEKLIMVEEKPEAVIALLQVVNTAPEGSLRRTAIPREAVDRIVAHRTAGKKKFESLDELMKVSGMTADQVRTVLEAYLATARDNPPATPATADDDPRASKMKQNAGAGVEAPDAPAGDQSPQAGPIISVRPGWYGLLPGYEHVLKGDPIVKEEFLETVNREICPCGCQNETLAFCLVNDPGCPVVKPRVKKIYDDIVKRAAEAKAAN